MDVTIMNTSAMSDLPKSRRDVNDSHTHSAAAKADPDTMARACTTRKIVRGNLRRRWTMPSTATPRNRSRRTICGGIANAS